MRHFLSIIFYGFIIVVVIGIINRRDDEPEVEAVSVEERIETRAVDPFDALKLTGDFRVVIRNGDTYSVTFSAPESLYPSINTQITGKTLHISTGRGMFEDEKVTLIVIVPDLKRIEAGGAVHLVSFDPLQGETVDIQMGGASEADLILDYTEVSARLSGAGRMRLQGEAEQARLQISGAGTLEAFDLQASAVEAILGGAATAQVFADHTLKARISGAGLVKYRGEPEVVESSISGAGNIRAD